MRIHSFSKFFFQAQTFNLKKAPTHDFLHHAVLCYAFFA